MHLSAVWLAPLAAGAAGAIALSVVAALARRELTALQRAMRPLRTSAPVRSAEAARRRS